MAVYVVSVSCLESVGYWNIAPDGTRNSEFGGHHTQFSLLTGPRTPEGKERSAKANWKHGRYSKNQDIETLREQCREVIKKARALLGDRLSSD